MTTLSQGQVGGNTSLQSSGIAGLKLTTSGQYGTMVKEAAANQEKAQILMNQNNITLPVLAKVSVDDVCAYAKGLANYFTIEVSELDALIQQGLVVEPKLLDKIKEQLGNFTNEEAVKAELVAELTAPKSKGALLGNTPEHAFARTASVLDRLQLLSYNLCGLISYAKYGLSVKDIKNDKLPYLIITKQVNLLGAYGYTLPQGDTVIDLVNPKAKVDGAKVIPAMLAGMQYMVGVTKITNLAQKIIAYNTSSYAQQNSRDYDRNVTLISQSPAANGNQATNIGYVPFSAEYQYDSGNGSRPGDDTLAGRTTYGYLIKGQMLYSYLFVLLDLVVNEGKQIADLFTVSDEALASYIKIAKKLAPDFFLEIKDNSKRATFYSESSFSIGWHDGKGLSSSYRAGASECLTIKIDSVGVPSAGLITFCSDYFSKDPVKDAISKVSVGKYDLSYRSIGDVRVLMYFRALLANLNSNTSIVAADSAPAEGEDLLDIL